MSKAQTVSSYMQNASEELKQIFLPEGLYEPELIVGISEILDVDDVVKIQEMLFGKPSWHLAFSTSLEKHSLSRMHRKLAQYQKMNKNENLLIMIKDKRKQVFGVLLLSSPSESKPAASNNTESHSSANNNDNDNDDHIDKNTTISLFNCRPFKQLSYHQKGQCVMKKYVDEFYIGCHDASCGLRLNQNLTAGRIHELNSKCATIQSENTIAPQLLNYTFEIKSLECWSFSYVDQQPVGKCSRMEYA